MKILDVESYEKDEVAILPQWCGDVIAAQNILKRSPLRITQEKMAKDLGCSRQAIWQALNGKGCSAEMKRAILEYIRDRQLELEQMRANSAS